MLVLRADPWAPEYGMGYEAVAEESGVAASDALVERSDWSTAVVPGATEGGVLCFVDGVRRIELRVVADVEGRRVPGLFGSYAVGSVRCDGPAAFDRHRVCRA